MAYYASEILIKKWQRNHMGTAAGIDVLLVTITYNQFKFTEDIRKINRIKVINIVCTILYTGQAMKSLDVRGKAVPTKLP